MRDLRQFEKRLAALISEAPPNAICFNYLSAAEVKAVFLVARVSGQAHPERGMRVLPDDWQEREAMHKAIWQTARVIGERQADISHRWCHKPLDPEYAKTLADRYTALESQKPLSHYEAEYAAYPHVMEKELAWCPQAEFWKWFDQEYPEEPESFYSTTPQ